MNIVAAAPLAAVAVPDADGGALAHVAGQVLPYAHGVVPYAAGMVPPAAYAAPPGDQLAEITPFLLDGALVTVQATLGGAVLATVLAFVTGLAALSRRRVVRAIARVYMEFFRGTSVIVQMFWIFFALPVLTGYRLAPLFAGILALGLNLGAYGSEVVRGGVLAVPQAQREAAIALNFTAYQRMRYVVLPQAFVGMLPPMNNLYIELLKATSLVSAVSVGDLMFEGKALINSGSHQATVMVVIMLIYGLLAGLITLGMRALERKAARSVGRSAPSARTATPVAALAGDGGA